ncbi:hypothetical protein SERLA73DRAFT_139147 [Serpula lacrymans var. lacrymans S7.3]|uniref:F-box domain-containing protein n=2 Tax=Serpula lacrymans var. lacrymans TaxID=341189 RepID=F8Q3K5_SERL3|nr:hypothetical protein SERLA73DRAFT_139147 [Serpula lacrymans var. lacrymans S7.3]
MANAPRIKHLGANNPGLPRIQRLLPKINVDILHSLLENCDMPSLLPSLSRLTFTSISGYRSVADFFRYISPFLSPKLTYLSFHIPQEVDECEIDALIEQIPRKAPNIEQLCLSSCFRSHQVVLSLTTANLPYLRELTVNRFLSMSTRSIRELSSLRFFQDLSLSLKVSFDIDKFVEGLDVHGSHGVFSTLRRIKFHTDTLLPCTSLFNLIQSDYLEEITVMVDEQQSASRVADFLNALRQSSRVPSTLRSICVRHNMQSSFSGDAPFIFNSSVFRPLLQFNKLKTIKFMNLGLYDLDDDFLSDAAMSWPDLEDFTFSRFPWSSTRKVTLQGILPLVSSCPNLYSLHITMDATSVERTAEHKLGAGPVNHNLKTLNVGDSDIQNPSDVAEFLFDIFPRLDMMFIHGGSIIFDRWQEVHSRMKQMQVKAGYRSIEDDDTLF